MTRMAEVRAWLSGNPVRADALLAVLVILFGIVPALVGLDDDSTPQVTTWVYPFLVLGAAALIVRRRHPKIVWALTAVAGLVAIAIEQGPSPAIVPVIVALYTLATVSPLRITLVATLVTAVAPRAIMGLQGETVVSAAINGLTVWCGLAAAIGFAVQKQRAVVAEAHERARQAEATREEEAQRRVAEERLRIARELHDVIAHHVSAINVQAGVAAHLLRMDPDRAAEALAHVREASQVVLREVPGLLGLLRSGEGIERAPAPSLARAGDLMEAARRSGLEVTWRMTGRPRDLSPSAELTAYRVLQEALTNAARHGSGTAVATLAYDATGCTLEVRNQRGHRSEVTNGERHGLVGIRERVVAAGGDLTVGPEGDRDWIVRVRLRSEERSAGAAT